MTQEQAFKIGFLAYCAENGLDSQETAALAKQAAAKPFEKQAFGEGLARAAGSAANLTFLAGLGVPLALGATGGYALAKATAGDRQQLLQEAKGDEIMAEYKRLAAEAKRRAQIRRLQQHFQSLTG